MGQIPGPKTRAKRWGATVAVFVVAISVSLNGNANTTRFPSGELALSSAKTLRPDRIHLTWTRAGKTVLEYEGRPGGAVTLVEWVDETGKGHFSASVVPADTSASTANRQGFNCPPLRNCMPNVPNTPTLPYRAAAPGALSLRHESFLVGRHGTDVACKALVLKAMSISSGSVCLMSLGRSSMTLSAQLNNTWARAEDASGDPGCNGCPYDSGYLTYSGTIYWHGTWTRYQVDDGSSTQDWTAERMQGTGHADGNGRYVLLEGAEQASYSSQSYLDQWNPSNKVPNQNCGSVAFSITVYGVGVSASAPVCPDYLYGRHADNNHVYGTEWHGKTAWADNSVGSAGVVSSVHPQGQSSEFVFSIYGAYDNKYEPD
jgi:hypothetical protein